MQTAEGVLCSLKDLGALAHAVLEQGACLRFRAHGSSMHPSIRHGDVVWVQPSMKVKVGDVVLARPDDSRVIAHRVVRKLAGSGKGYVQTKGDARLQPDRPIPCDQLLGQVVRLERTRGEQTRSVRLDGVQGCWVGWLWARFPRASRWSHRVLATIPRRCARLWRACRSSLWRTKR